MNEDVEIIEASGIAVIEAQQRAEYDQQITTAKRYPRNLTKVKDNCIAIVTMDDETAASCRYALPRGGKKITGPSVHLARILAQQYGNVRVDARVKQITDTQIISEAVCFDLETNYACKVEVRRSIISMDKQSGRKSRYSDDMITVTGNAANSIALRNAILNVIPKSISSAAYNAAAEKILGDVSDENKLIAARKKALDYFKDKHSVSEERILKHMGLNSVNQIKKEQILDLRSMAQAIKDGDSTVEEMFPDLAKTSATSQADKVKHTFEQKPAVEKQAENPDTTPASTPPPATDKKAATPTQKAGLFDQAPAQNK